MHVPTKISNSVSNAYNSLIEIVKKASKIFFRKLKTIVVINYLYIIRDFLKIG